MEQISLPRISVEKVKDESGHCPMRLEKVLDRRRGCVLASKEKKYIKTDDQKKIRRSIGEWKFLIKCTALMKQWKRQNLKSKQPMHGNSEYVTARTIDDEVA